MLANMMRHAHLVGDGLGDLLAAGGQALGDGLDVLAPLLLGGRPQVSNAALAAATARSTSSAVPAGIVAMISSVEGFSTSMVSVPVDGTHAPSM